MYYFQLIQLRKASSADTTARFLEEKAILDSTGQAYYSSYLSS